MRRFLPRLTCAALLAFGSASGFAQSSGQSPGVSLRIETDLIRIPIDNSDPVPLFVDADVIRGRGRDEIEAEGDAILRKRGQSIFADYIRHSGEEFVFVLSGELELRFENGHAYRLGAGDSLYFDSAVGHVYLSLGDTDAEVLACCVDGDSRRPRDAI